MKKRERAATRASEDNGIIATTAAAGISPVSLPGAELNIIEQPLTLRVLNNDLHNHQHHSNSHHHLNEVIEIEIQDTSNRIASGLVNPIIKIEEYSQANESSHLNDNNNNHNNTDNINNLVNAAVTATITTPNPSSKTAAAEADANAIISVNRTSKKLDENISKKIDCTTSNDHILNEISSIVPSNSTGISSTVKSKKEETVLDIPSHLIETLNDYHNSDLNIVRIKELTPIEAELQSGLSTVETADCIGRTIIEVEPAGLVSKKPIEYPIQYPKTIKLTEIIDEVDNSNCSTQLKSDNISNLTDIIHGREEISANGLSNSNNKKDEEASQTIDFNLEKENILFKESIKREQSDEDSINTELSKQIDQQLSEVSYILEAQQQQQEEQQPNGVVPTNTLNLSNATLKLITVPSPKTIADEKERQLFIDSLPQINGIINDSTTYAHTISLDFNREYYQSLKKYLIQSTLDRPPVPLKTYRWEDLRRAKERGGYPWTHLYKRPLGPDEEPEIILMLRKSQEIHFTADSPKFTKKVRIDEQVTVKEAKLYVQELSEEGKQEGGEETNAHLSEPHLTSLTEDSENQSLQSESFSCVSDSILTAGKHSKKSQRFSEVRRLFRRRRYGTRPNEDIRSLPDSCPVREHTVKKRSLEAISLAKHSQNTSHIVNVSLYDNVKVGHCFPIIKKLKTMADRQKKRLKIRRIPLGKDERITFNEETKILKLKNSPKSQRSDIPHFVEKQDSDDVLEIVELEESPSHKRRDEEDYNTEVVNGISTIKPEEIIDLSKDSTQNVVSEPPKKTPRLRREHVYEEIDQPIDFPPIQQPQFNFILDATSVEALKQSLVTQDRSAMRELTPKNKIIPLDRMGSSEEEQLNATDQQHVQQQSHEGRSSDHHLAPISSIDSTSSDEDRTKIHLPEVIEEESDQPEDDQHEQQIAKHVTLVHHNYVTSPLPSAIKKEASPAPSEKKVTFSHVEDEAEPLREDIELSDEHMAASREANKAKIYATNRDHEYEPIGSPSDKPSEELDTIKVKETEKTEEKSTSIEGDAMKHAETVQRDLEARFFNNTSVLPQMDADVANGHTVYKETVVQEPMNKQEKKGFMASAQDHTRKVHAGLKNQAGKLKTKLQSSRKKSPSDSPKFKARKRFKAPEFSKIKIPDIKRPDISKLKELKRPEFTKFNKIDMSRFKFPEKISAMKLKRSKSLKENEEEETLHNETAEISPKSETLNSQKKLFDFNFGTYPRALSRNKKKKPLEFQSSFETGTEPTSAVTSTGTQPSFESSSSPQGDRGPGPVRSRWADKFSDVSYNDSEGSRYRRFESEQGSFDRESSMERRIREDVEDTASEDPTLTILGGVTDNKQFAEFDEENRAIHEISNLRSGEFKRRPIVHQDSDVKSDDSKDVIGWTEKDIAKNSLLLRGEVESDEAFMIRQPEDSITQETQSTTSSGKKLVLEEIDEDEFFLRKRGISQDNIELRQYISDAIRGKYDKSNEQNEDIRSYEDYGHTPPPKPRRLYRADNDFQHNYFDDDNENVPPSDEQINKVDQAVPKIPLRKLRGRRKYSTESGGDEQSYQLPYFDNDEDYLRPPSISQNVPHKALNNLNSSINQGDVHLNKNTETVNMKPQPPRRQKKRREMSLEKDSFINGFGGRSVSNSFLQTPEDVIVYRTEHEYHHIPLATPEKYSDSFSIRKSLSNYDDYEDRKSRGAVSLEPNLNGAISNKYFMDLSENDGYAVVKKDHVPKPTPPARRKKFTRLPGERFATMPSMVRSNRSTSPPERPPPPKTYTPNTNHLTSAVPNIMNSLNAQLNQNKNVAVDEIDVSSLRPESPRDLNSGDVINKMKYRPLPPPPRPPREKRQNLVESSDMEHTTDTTEQQFDTSSQEPKEDDSILRYTEEVEASTQTDPLPDDFVCDEFEITDDMKVIVPRVYATKTLDQILQEELRVDSNLNDQGDGSEQLTKGLQNFREANQRSLSERSRISSQAEQRSKSLSRPQTPSAIVREHEILTPVPKGETVIQASLVVQPIDDHDLVLDEEIIHKDVGLLSPNSQPNISLMKDELAPSEASYAPSSTELNEAIELLASDPDAQQTDEEVERTLQRYREELDEIGRQLMETAMSQELSSAHSKDDTKEISYREEIRSDEEQMQGYPSGSEAEPFRSDDETQYESKISTTTLTEQEHIQRISPGVNEKELPSAPHAPPRKKSIILDQLMLEEAAIAPLQSQEITRVQSLVRTDKDSTVDLSCRVSDLEVDRLRVHALQAGKIMVSQLHGSQIISDELDCKSGNLIVKNIELPPRFIEDIVKRVRQTERSQLQTNETQTQTSLESTPEKRFTKSPPRDNAVPPPKPPRLKDLEIKDPSRPQSADEETQTELTLSLSSPISTAIPTLFPNTEYLQSLTPLAFYNLHRETNGSGILEMSIPSEINRVHQRIQQRPRTQSISDNDINHEEEQTIEYDDKIERTTRTNQTRTINRTKLVDDAQSVSQAGRKFITACSLSLVKIINQLTDYVKGNKMHNDSQEVTTSPTDIRNRQVPALVVLFIVITFAVLIFLATGRNIHTHHWDYFNPPGHDGRQSS